MRTLLTIALTMFTMAGCLAEAPAPHDEADEHLLCSDPQVELDQGPRPQRIPNDDLIPPAKEVKHCVVSDDCVLDDPDTEFRMCDLSSGTWVRNPLPF